MIYVLHFILWSSLAKDKLHQYLEPFSFNLFFATFIICFFIWICVAILNLGGILEYGQHFGFGGR